jgi:hypothetical protein
MEPQKSYMIAREEFFYVCHRQYLYPADRYWLYRLRHLAADRLLSQPDG